jgi:hypothetical protein
MPLALGDARHQLDQGVGLDGLDPVVLEAHLEGPPPDFLLPHPVGATHRAADSRYRICAKNTRTSAASRAGGTATARAVSRRKVVGLTPAGMVAEARAGYREEARHERPSTLGNFASRGYCVVNMVSLSFATDHRCQRIWSTGFIVP